MMKKILLLSFFTLFLVSCGSTKTTSGVTSPNVGKNQSKTKSTKKLSLHANKKFSEPEVDEDTLIENPTEALDNLKRQIIDYAKTFQGTRYKFGGTTEAGMDCSGLVCVAFQKESIELPRISRDMATKGVLISYNEIEEGDLVFFKTSRRNTISHVGLVVEANNGEVKFIHSTTSAGVIISSMEETYWKKAFAEVRRVI